MVNVNGAPVSHLCVYMIDHIDIKTTPYSRVRVKIYPKFVLVGISHKAAGSEYPIVHASGVGCFILILQQVVCLNQSTYCRVRVEPGDGGSLDT